MYWKNRNISVWKRKLDLHKPPQKSWFESQGPAKRSVA